VALLKRDEARLFPRDRRYRDDLIRFSKGEASFLEVFGAGHIPRPEPSPKPRDDEVGPLITPPEAPVVDQLAAPPEPPALDLSDTPSAPEVMPSTDGIGELMGAKKPIFPPPKALLALAGFVIGAVILAAYFLFSPGDKSVPLQKQASLAATHEDAGKSVTASPVEKAPSEQSLDARQRALAVC
jgi:hypothetical protein